MQTVTHHTGRPQWRTWALAIVGALALTAGGFVAGQHSGAAHERTALAALPTQTPVVIVRTRTVSRTVVVTPTPVPPPPAPQHRISGATACAGHMCVRPIGYTLRAAPGEGQGWTSGRQWKRLDVWFHVENRGLFDNSVSHGNFAVGIKAWSVMVADAIPDTGSANITLVAGGATDGKETFDVPAASHAANLRFQPSFSAFSDNSVYGSWDVSY